MRIEQFDQLGEVGKRARQAIDFVDDDDINLARSDIGEKLLQRRAFRNPPERPLSS